MTATSTAPNRKLHRVTCTVSIFRTLSIRGATVGDARECAKRHCLVTASPATGSWMVESHDFTPDAGDGATRPLFRVDCILVLRRDLEVRAPDVSNAERAAEDYIRRKPPVADPWALTPLSFRAVCTEPDPEPTDGDDFGDDDMDDVDGADDD